MNFFKTTLITTFAIFASGCGPTMPRNPEYKNAIYTYCSNTVKASSSSGVIDQASLSKVAKLFDENYTNCIKRKSKEYIEIETSQRIALERIKKEEDEQKLDNHLTQTCLNRRMNPHDESFKLCKMQVRHEMEQALKAEQMEKRLRAQMRELEYDSEQRESNLKLQLQGQKITDDLLRKMQDDLNNSGNKLKK